MVGIGAGGIVLAAALGILVARTALTPIARFTRRTEAVAAGADPSQRLEVTGRDELARLAGTFNRTLDELERSVDSQRNLVADLNDPLHAIDHGDRGGDCVAAVSGTGLKLNRPTWRMDEVGVAIREAADQITVALGGPPFAARQLEAGRVP